MDLARLSLDQFLNVTDFPEVDPIRDAFVGDFSSFAEIFEPLVREPIRRLSEHYFLAQLDDDLGDVALMCRNELVGFYHGNVLILHDAHQGRGLSIPLILAAVKSRPAPGPRMLTTAGRAALTRAWQVANGLAANPWP